MMSFPIAFDAAPFHPTSGTSSASSVSALTPEEAQAFLTQILPWLLAILFLVVIIAVLTGLLINEKLSHPKQK
jgi:integrase